MTHPPKDNLLSANPLVTVCLVTYNHRLFAQQAIESILAQQTTFAFQVLVMDDASKDGTQAILRDAQQANPERVKLLLNRRNMGKNNFIKQFKQATSPYVAFLEGDDYWTDPFKLQTQVDFLERNPTFFGCVHNVMVNRADTPDTPMGTITEPVDVTIEDLIGKASYFHFSSFVLRNIYKGQLPPYYTHPSTGDWFLSMLHAQYGPLRYLPGCMSTYRIHAAGMWSALSPHRNTMTRIDGLFHYNKALNLKYQDLFFKLALWWSDGLLKNLTPDNSHWLDRFKYTHLSKYLMYYFAEYYGYDKASLELNAYLSEWIYFNLRRLTALKYIR